MSLVQLPLTPLVASAVKRSNAGDPERVIRIVPIRGGGSEVQYGILSPTSSAISFEVPLGRHPRFIAGIDMLDRNSEIPGVTEFAVEVETQGVFNELGVRSVKNSGYERRRRISIDLHTFAGESVRLVLKTRSGKSEGNYGSQAVWCDPRVVSRRSLAQQFSQLTRDVRKLGMHGVAKAFVDAWKGELVVSDRQGLYQLWIERNELQDSDILRMRDDIRTFRVKPLISIVTPVHNTEPQWLERCIESVRRQFYPEWQLCLVNDASTRPEVRRILDAYTELDERISVVHLPLNQGIALASNVALGVASGEYVGFLDHDDELTPDALYEVVALLQDHPELDVVYSDEDKLDPDGTRSEPFFKPDWSPEYLLSCMYTCHFTVYRRSLIEQVGKLRQGYEGSQDYDLMLRVTEHTSNVFHIPKILYHWRRIAGSAAESRNAKPYAYEAGKRALADRFRRLRQDTQLSDGKLFGFYRVRHEVDSTAKVSIIIPTRDNVDFLRRCIESIEARTSYPNYEIVVVDNLSTEPETARYLAVLPHAVLTDANPFNFSRLNNFAAERANGDYLVFLNDDTEVISGEWLTAMLEFCQQPQIGVVGAKLLFPDGSIQHAGITLGLGGVAGHMLTGFPGGSPHYFGIGSLIRNCSAVTGACLMMRHDVFEAVGGFDERLAVAYNDVDLCLRVRQQGLRIVWTPFAELYHHQSASRDDKIDPEEIKLMKSRWGSALVNDPYYNPNLTLEHQDLRLRI